MPDSSPLDLITIIIAHRFDVDNSNINTLLLLKSSHTPQAAPTSPRPQPKKQPKKMPPLSSQPSALFQARRQSLQIRVNEAAKTLRDQGISPTVARIRTTLGGGSPNDLAPALKHWKESILPTLGSSGLRGTSATQHSPLPRQVADLAQELWQRSLTAAVLEMKGGPTARDLASRTAEAQALRDQLTSVRDQLDRESLAYGELRAQAARHEAIARDALTRLQESEDRERRLHRELGSLRQRVTELEALLKQANSRPSRHPAVRPTFGKIRKGKKAQPAQKAPRPASPRTRQSSSLTAAARVQLKRTKRRRPGQ